MSANFEIKRNIGTTCREERDALYDAGEGDCVQFGTLDSAQGNSSDSPIGQPTDDSTAYSMEAWLYLKMTNAPENNVTNFRFWSSGQDIDSGIYMFVGSANASATPSLNKSIEATHNAVDYTGPGDSFLWSTVVCTAVGDLSRHLVMQARITATANVGDHNNPYMVYHYSYDEA